MSSSLLVASPVCPDADVKIFVTADVEVRARRRFEELRRLGEPVTYDRVLEVIRRRDERDSGRANAPMKAAPDAFLLDTTELGVEQTLAEALQLITAQLATAKR